MKKVFVCIFAAMAMTANAQVVKVGDIVPYGDLNLEVMSLSPAEMRVTESPFAEGFVEIPDVVTHYDVDFTIVEIGPQAFSNGTDDNPAITGVSIPNTIREIGWQAFLSCNRIEKLHLPASLKKIGNAAFWCYADKPSILSEITCDATMPPSCGEMVFGTSYNSVHGISPEIPVYVPKGCVEAYKAAKGWNFFVNITDGEAPQGIEEVDAMVGLDITKPMYDMLGKKVTSDHKGMIIQGGRKIVVIEN